MKKALILAVVLALMVPTSTFASTNEEQISLLWKEVKALQKQLNLLIERMDTKNLKEVRVEVQTVDTCFLYETGRNKTGCSALGG